MRTDLFDFDLPPERIALRPAQPRDSAKMLVVENGALRDQIIADLPQWLRPGDQLVVNDTKVIAAQLKGRRIGRETEPKIEATLIKPSKLEQLCAPLTPLNSWLLSQCGAACSISTWLCTCASLLRFQKPCRVAFAPS